MLIKVVNMLELCFVVQHLLTCEYWFCVQLVI
jgi:hypothetical protein